MHAVNTDQEYVTARLVVPVVVGQRE